MAERAYFDWNATAPLRAEARATMTAALSLTGNASAVHAEGRAARRLIEDARVQVAALVGAEAKHVTFTSGATEANMLALTPVLEIGGRKEPRDRLLVSSVEHPAVINPCRWLEGEGFRVTYLPVDGYGMVDPDEVRKAITDETLLISIMHANNEVGTIQPIAAIAEIARENGVVFHTDAAQSVGKIPARVDDLNVDLLSVAAHKLYGPKGVGALYVRNGIQMEQLIHGASHEDGRRAGTENVAGIAGLGKACELAEESLEDRMGNLTSLRDEFHRLLKERAGPVILNGHPDERLPNTLNISFPGINAGELLAKIPEICASTGSACHHGSETLSPVLEAMGVGQERGLGAVRFSIGHWTTREELRRAADLIGERVSF